MGSERGRGGVEPSRTAKIGGTRVARSAGTMLASTVIAVPTIRLTTIVRVAKTVPAWGRSIPDGDEERVHPLADAEPEEQADHRCHETDDEPLEDDRPRAPGGGSRRASAPSRTLASAARR